MVGYHVLHYTTRSLHGSAMLGASQPRHTRNVYRDDETPLTCCVAGSPPLPRGRQPQALESRGAAADTGCRCGPRAADESRAGRPPVLNHSITTLRRSRLLRIEPSATPDKKSLEFGTDTYSALSGDYKFGAWLQSAAESGDGGSRGAPRAKRLEGKQSGRPSGAPEIWGRRATPCGETDRSCMLAS
eukprot:scaffold44374_cov53-Phaeocystis_antarctica.AAC.5